MDANEKWISPTLGFASCPACGGFGYTEDGTEDGVECPCCVGNGVATVDQAERWLAAHDPDWRPVTPDDYHWKRAS